jgi:hypothetical protein
MQTKELTYFSYDSDFLDGYSIDWFLFGPINDLSYACIWLYPFPFKARAGVEMALIDAVANSIRIPLWRLFGGASDSVTTDITVRLPHCTDSWKLLNAITKILSWYFPIQIPIVTPNEAAQLAAKYPLMLRNVEYVCQFKLVVFAKCHIFLCLLTLSTLNQYQIINLTYIY